jgi:hypothetical protein
MADLLDYPTAANWKAQGTSALAAEAAAEKAPIWRARCLATIAAAPKGLTACQVADLLRHDIASTRPRVSERFKMGLIRKSEERRPTRWGCTAIVWVVAGEDAK